MRRLGAEEAALWARVAASVRPLPGRVRPMVPQVAAHTTDPLPDPPPPPRRTTTANRVAVDAATLDGGWDRKLRTGRLDPDFTLDLHGYGRAAAHGLLTGCVTDAAASGLRVLLVITGKGARGDDIDGRRGRGEYADSRRGVIRASLRDWLQDGNLRPYIAALRPAHPRHGGGGAWYVILRRR